MFNELKSSQLRSRAFPALAAQGGSLFANQSERPLQPFSVGTRSRLEIGRFDAPVFSSSGSVRRDFPDVFRFSLQSRSRLRIYVGNEFTNTSSSSQRMTVELLDDRTLRRVTNMTVNPRGINAITRNIDPGTYRVRISTQSNSRGRYFIDMVRL